jgi:ElaB/YqjD/DUF883 family membrane-anchored ribosome-binding protein
MATNNEEIIERKEGSPVATSCLIIACVAIIGAITMQIAELTQVRASWDPQEREANQVLKVKADQERIIDGIQKILGNSKLLTDEKKEELKSTSDKSDKLIEDAKKEARGEGSAEAEDTTEADDDAEAPTEPDPEEKDSSSDDTVDDDF